MIFARIAFMMMIIAPLLFTIKTFVCRCLQDFTCFHSYSDSVFGLDSHRVFLGVFIIVLFLFCFAFYSFTITFKSFAGYLLTSLCLMVCFHSLFGALSTFSRTSIFASRMFVKFRKRLNCITFCTLFCCVCLTHSFHRKEKPNQVNEIKGY